MGARYFYSVWLRHLVCVSAIRPNFSFNVVAELGPGDALGIGICALLSGAKRYIGLDRIAFGLRADNLSLLNELTELFKRREPIPDDEEFPGVYPQLHDYSFPHYILTDELLEQGLSSANIERLKKVLLNSDLGHESILGYSAPWDSKELIASNTVDLLLSQAVLEHVDEIEGAYRAMGDWLKTSGVMSHRIDYTCHGITRDWYGHWTISANLWTIVRGKRAYLINRFTHSRHINAMKKSNLKVVSCLPTVNEVGAPEVDVRVPYEPTDLCIRGAYIVAEKYN